MTRDIARTSHGVWGTFWGKVAFLSEAPGPVRLIDGGEQFAALCRDGAGRVWSAGRGGILRLDADGAIRRFEGTWDPERCGEGTGSRRWVVSAGRVLWTVDAGEALPRRVPLGFNDEDGLSLAAEDRAPNEGPPI